jgi:glycosyltransferase involved in cell wall biosynthesis
VATAREFPGWLPIGGVAEESPIPGLEASSAPGPSQATELVLVSTGMVSIPPINGGAVEAYVADLARMFSRRPGYRVSVISNHRALSELGWSDGARFVPTHSPIDSFPLRPAPSALAHLIGGSISATVAYRALGRLPRGERTVVHLNEEISAMAFAQLGAHVGRVFTIHNPPPSTGERAYGGLEYAIRHLNARATWRFALRRMDAVVALSGWIRDFLVEEWKLEEDRVHLLPLPVDTNAFRPAFESAPTEAPPSETDLLFVGRLEPRKNVLTAVEALKFLPPEVRLTVIGDGPLASVTAERARSLGVSDRVRVVNRIPLPGLMGLYRRSTLLVHPSFLEAYPRVVVEASACGLPTVLPDSPMFQEFLDGGGTVGYPPEEGARGLAEAALGLLNDPARRIAARQAARRFAIRNNSYEAFADRLAKVYDAALP